MEECISPGGLVQRLGDYEFHRMATGRPVSGTQVRLSHLGSAKSFRTITDGVGGFRFEGLEEGLWYPKVSHSLYSFEWRKGALTIRAGVSLNNVVFEIMPQVVIAGRVVDGKGDPVARASITLYRSVVDFQGQSVIDSVFVSAADERGEYRMTNLPPARYFLTATKKSPKEVGLTAATFYPKAFSFETAQPLELEAGTHLRADFRLERVPTVEVRGRLVYPGRILHPMFDLSDRRAKQHYVCSFQFKQSTASFILRDVVPGEYHLRVDAVDEQRRIILADQNITVGHHGSEGLQLNLGPERIVSGRTRVEGEENVDFAQERVVIRIPTRPAGGNWRAELGKNGQFQIKNMFPGHYPLEVESPRLYLKSAFFEGRNVLESGLTIQPDRDPGELEMILSREGAEIRGTVRTTEETDSRSKVFLLQERLDGTWIRNRSSYPEGDGVFTMSGLAPGKYRVCSWRMGDEVPYLEPAYLRTVAAECQALEVQERSKNAVELKVIQSHLRSYRLR